MQHCIRFDDGVRAHAITWKTWGLRKVDHLVIPSTYGSGNMHRELAQPSDEIKVGRWDSLQKRNGDTTGEVIGRLCSICRRDLREDVGETRRV